MNFGSRAVGVPMGSDVYLRLIFSVPAMSHRRPLDPGFQTLPTKHLQVLILDSILS